MPELPDIELYLSALKERVLGERFLRLHVFTPFALRSVEPSPKSLEGRSLVALRRLGKRVVFEFEGGMFLVLHLMIAGRLYWRPTAAKFGGKIAVAALEFPTGSAHLTEAGSKKRAALTIIQGEQGLRSIDPGGIEPLQCSYEAFAHALGQENRTLKRGLTDPHSFSGIGNAYSDEILHAARLSPLKQSGSLSAEETRRLYDSVRQVLTEWTERLARQFAGRFPEKGDVTAFRPEFAVHGKYGQPCPVCGKPVQRIVYADNECNYCAICQNEGRVLADRALSRLLKDAWPRSLD